MDRREPFTLIEKMRLDDPTSDHAIVLKVIDEDWMTQRDIVRTLASRDHRWTPDHVRSIIANFIEADIVSNAGLPPLVKYRRKHRA